MGVAEGGVSWVNLVYFVLPHVFTIINGVDLEEEMASGVVGLTVLVLAVTLLESFSSQFIQN